MTLTKEEVVKRREQLENQLIDAQLAVEQVRVDMKGLQRLCKHPDKKSYTYMGEAGSSCPDCGWET